jgi:transcriptional regulator with XRE-family HTH domain
MTLFDERKEKLINELRDQEYREAFISEHIASGVPFQIKALRDQREWSQKELGKKANMLQARISVLEDPNYAKFNINTLKKIASAFDVGLVVRFVPFGELAEWELNLSSESLKVPSFNEDPYFQENKVSEKVAITNQYHYISNISKIDTVTIAPGKMGNADMADVISLKDFIADKTAAAQAHFPIALKAG